MASCSASNATTTAKLHWGQQGDLELTITRSASSNVSLLDAEITFTYGQNFDTPIQTILPVAIDLPTNTAEKIIATFSVNAALIVAALGVQRDHTLFWQAVIVSTAGPTATITGQITLENAFDELGAIVEPPDLVLRYLTTGQIDPSGATDGQVLKFSTVAGKFIPDTDEGGGGGGGITSVNGDTGPAVVLTTSDIAEGTNLYYTDARFEAALGAALTTDFSAAIQAIFSAAGTALQPGANISTLTNDAGFTTFDGAYSNLSGIPTTFTPSAHTQAISTITGLQDALDDKQPLDTALTQLSGIAVANGQVIGWSGGVLANIAIGGGGDMSKSVYDTDDNGIVDAAESVPWAGVTSTPTTLAGYGITDAFDGAYSSLSGIPTTFTPSAHNQAWSTITGTPTTLAGYGITDAATSSQGALADTALQPGDAIPQADVTGLAAALGGKVDNTITLTAGTGLDGGGNLTTNRSFALDAATLASLNLADSAVQPAAISNFETTTQLNDRDTANRDPDNFSVIADLKTFLNAADTAAARAAIGVIVRQPPIIGTTRTSVSLTTTKADSTLEAAITLTNASSRVLIWVAQSWELPVDGNSGLGLYLNRGATEILDPNPVDGTGPFLIYKFIAASGFNGTAQLMHIDTPGSIGPHTYKSRARSYNANGAELQPAGATQNAISSILLLEVA